MFDLWYGCNDDFSLWGDFIYAFKNTITNIALGLQQWWINTVTSANEGMKQTATNFNLNSFVHFSNMPVVNSIINVATTFGIIFVFVKFGFAVFKYYSVQLDDGVSPLTVDFIKKVVFSCLFCVICPILIFTGFSASTQMGTFFVQALNNDAKPPEINVVEDMRKNHLSLKTYCYEGIKIDKEEGNSNTILDNIVEGSHEYKTKNFKIFEDSKTTIKGNFITLFPEGDENNTGETMTKLYNSYCNTQTIYDGYAKDKDGNFIKDENGNNKKNEVKNKNDKIETFEPMRVVQTINNNPDLNSQIPTSLMGFLTMLCAFLFCAVTAFNICVRLAELLGLLIMLPFYASTYVDVGQSNAMKIWLQEFLSIIVSHLFSIIFFNAFMIFAINVRELWEIGIAMGMVFVQMKGASALRAWTHNTGVSQVGSKLGSGIKNAFKK